MRRFLVVLALALCAGAAYAAPPPDKETVSVLVRVRLDQPFVPEGNLNARARNAQRDRIRRAQGNIERKYGHAAIAFESIPHMLMTVDRHMLEAMSKDGDVARVDVEKVMTPILADSAPQVEAPYLWNTVGATGAGYSVAVLDSGVESTHSFLQQNSTTSKVVKEACFSRNDSSSSFTSLCTSSTAPGLTSSTAAGSAAPCSGYGVVCQHGTIIAGVAVGRNGSFQSLSFNGVAKDANLVAVKVVTLAPSGGSSIPVALEGDLIRALLWVDTVRTDASVASVNISFATTSWPWAVSVAERASYCDSGGEDGTYPGPNSGSSHSAMYDAVEALRSHGVIVVGGTGNGRANKVAYPACTPNFLAVGAVTKDDHAWSVSSSEGTNSAEAMDLWAPGAGWSSGGSGPGANGILSSIPGNTYQAFPGTSLAAPHVAGAIAVLKQASPSSSVTDIINALRSSGPVITDSLNGVSRHRLDLKRAYYHLADTTAPSAPVLTVNATGSTSVLLTWTASTDAQSGIDYYIVQRRASYGAGWTDVATPSTAAAYTDTVPAANVGYQYRVQAVNLAGAQTASNMDITAMKVFSTDLHILGQHIIDLREAANRICTFAGTSACASAPFSSDYATQLTALKAESGIDYHRFTELRTAIENMRSAVGVPAPSWYTPAPATGGYIKVEYLDELRNAVN